MSNVLKFCLLTDLHIGHPRLSPQHLYNNLVKYLYPQLNADIDILFIGGDFFHTLLFFDSVIGYMASYVINELIQLSIRYDFKIRIVRGTYSHDRDQLKMFLAIKTDSSDRVKLYDTVSIEYISKLDLHILYIPDDLPTTDGIGLIKKCLRDNQLDKVDVILGHGCFDHMLPIHMPHQPPNTYTYDMFKDMVNGCIMFGHIHTSSLNRNIIGGGSFDRMTHGEEESKGFYTIEYNKNDRIPCKYNFHCNKDAACFRTIDVSHFNDDLDQILTKLQTEINKIISTYKGLNFINLRIVITDNVQAQAIKSFIKKINPDIIVKTVKPKALSDQPIDEIKLELTDLPNITRQNLSELVFEHLKQEGVEISRKDVDRILEV